MQRSRCDAGEQNRKARLALRAAVSPTLPAGVNAVFLEVDPWSYKAYLCGSEVEQLLASLCASGAAVLLLRTPGHFASSRWGFEENALNTDGALARCFKEAGTLACRALPHVVRAKDGNVVVEARLGQHLPAEYATVDAAVQAKYKDLSLVARCLLMALSPPTLAPLQRVTRSMRTATALGTAPVRQFANLMEFLDGPLEPYERGCSTLSLLRHKAGAGEAEQRTDPGLLTLMHACGPGLELRTRAGWQPLACEGALIVLAGATLEAATGGAIRAAAHRIAPQNVPRCSVVMRVHGKPEALLPGAPGGTVAGFETQFRAMQGSGTVPPGSSCAAALTVGEGNAAARSVTTAPRATRARAASLADVVLAVPELAALIVDALAAIDDTGVALARAELVCRALRAAVAPIWARQCAELHRRGSLQLPVTLAPAGHVTQWKRLFRHSTEPRLRLNISQGYTSFGCKVRPSIRMERIFSVYCDKMNFVRARVRFLYDGVPVDSWQTPRSLRMVDLGIISAVVEPTD